MSHTSWERHGRGAVATACALGLFASGAQAQDVASYRDAAGRIIAAAKDGKAWQRLAELTDTFGNRLSGSARLEAAIRWCADQMKKDGLENVRLEPVMVPAWVRGAESLELVEPAGGPLVLLGLGNSIGTPAAGITGEVVAVRSYEELEARAAEVKGRIVLFNVPFTNYGETVKYRGGGASQAAQKGAVAMLLRSVGLPGLRTAHTGGMNYDKDQPQIPAAAIPVEDADRIQRILDRKQKVVVTLKMEAKFLPDSESANVVAEWRGREKPDEVVVIGGHIDSWDVGVGAMDDGGGSMAAWEAVRVLKSLNLRPRRTIRVVLFTNEENGLRGGTAYKDAHQGETHVAALESDSGVFKPVGVGFTGSDAARATVREIAALLAPIAATEVAVQGGGADIGPIVKEQNLPSLSLDVDGARYFLLHHTQADTLNQLDPAEVAASAATMAVMAYVIAELPERLPQAPAKTGK